MAVQGRLVSRAPVNMSAVAERHWGRTFLVLVATERARGASASAFEMTERFGKWYEMLKYSFT